MEQIISTEKKPIKMWLNDIEDTALAQAKNLANLPFVHQHIAIMPDAHQGYGMPIGGVIATQDVIIPNAVGVDIGCGMCAVKTSLKNIENESLKKIMGSIRTRIPVGFSHHSKKQDKNLMPEHSGSDYSRSDYSRSNYSGPALHYEGKHNPVIEKEFESARQQIGTLGGGNHFIEIQKGNDGFIWLMIHSGSRNLGFKVAKYYNKLANMLSQKFNSKVPKKWELAFLPLDSDQGRSYYSEMMYCVDFALASRELMMERVKDSIFNVCNTIEFEEPINIAHNYAMMEYHFHKNVMIHRKGATRAYEGQLGIIPGSQGASSYIVKGLGNKESFMSCSHGAGRKMGRKQAIRQLDFNAERKRLDDMGVIHSIRKKNDLDEAAGAYKDISRVMQNQRDLVEIIVELKPLAVVKG